MADWSAVEADFDIDVVDFHIADPDELVGRLVDSEVVVAMRERTPFPATLLSRLPALRLLVTTGPMNAAIDLAAAHEHGVTVSGTSGKGNSMPELVFGMMVALAREFVEEDRSVRTGGWQHTIGPGLADRTLGLVGLGRLGQRVAVLAQAFSMNVVAWSPNLTKERAEAAGVTAVTREELFAGSDYISIHMVLADATRGLIGAEDLARMGPEAYLINTSRGPIVDEAALVDVLRRGASAEPARRLRCRAVARRPSPARHAPHPVAPPHRLRDHRGLRGVLPPRRRGHRGLPGRHPRQSPLNTLSRRGTAETQ